MEWGWFVWYIVRMENTGRTVAALFVQEGSRGSYYGLEGVDCWGITRDARKYEGPWPVVGHPPCARWCALAGLVRARYGYEVGDDGGCFEAALRSVRTWGGVLEHPAFSKAWGAYGLARPPTGGGWVRADEYGGWTCYVEQVHYGHPARKGTWLYACKTELPELIWGRADKQKIVAMVSWCANRTKETDKRKRIGKNSSSKTPVAFRDVLIGMARTVRLGMCLR